MFEFPKVNELALFIQIDEDEVYYGALCRINMIVPLHIYRGGSGVYSLIVDTS